MRSHVMPFSFATVRDAKSPVVWSFTLCRFAKQKVSTLLESFFTTPSPSRHCGWPQNANPHTGTTHTFFFPLCSLGPTCVVTALAEHAGGEQQRQRK